MKNSKALTIYLTIAGLLLTLIGSGTLLMPETIKAAAGIDLGGNVNVLNDLRASAAVILSFALLLLAGAFSEKLRFTSSLIAPMLFLALGVGRLLSISMDGMPVDGLVQATGLEFVLGIVGTILFLKNKQ